MSTCLPDHCIEESGVPWIISNIWTNLLNLLCILIELIPSTWRLRNASFVKYLFVIVKSHWSRVDWHTIHTAIEIHCIPSTWGIEILIFGSPIVIQIFKRALNYILRNRKIFNHGYIRNSTASFQSIIQSFVFIFTTTGIGKFDDNVRVFLHENLSISFKIVIPSPNINNRLTAPIGSFRLSCSTRCQWNNHRRSTAESNYFS